MRKTQKEIIAMFVATAEKFIKKVDDTQPGHPSGWLYFEFKECLKAATPTITTQDLASTDKPLTPLQKLILKYFMVKGPMTDDVLELTINQFSPIGKKYPPSSIRSRRAELVAMGKLRCANLSVHSANGRTVKSWEATPKFDWMVFGTPSGRISYLPVQNIPVFQPSPTEKFIPNH